MTLRFGTDGVRGVAGAELSAELALALGRAAARVLPGGPFVIGRDTRRSGPMIEAAVAAGLAAEGVDVERLGVLPTPGVAWRCARDGLPGVVISASHNPFADNGVKLLAPGGTKLSAAQEAQVEAELDRVRHAPGSDAGGPAGTALGQVADRPDAAAGYVAALVGSLEGRRLDGLRVVLDCANGAAWAVGPEALRRLGVDLTVLHDRPDGRNINEGCGSTSPDDLRNAVVERGADVGLALDGDADRVVAVDHTGRVVDGDQLIAVCALDLRARGALRDDAVVVTVMTNLGFRVAMAGHGISVIETPVGDRHVLEALDARRLSLGGEQSGHVIFRDLATTGDGVLTGIQVLDVVRRSGRPLADLAAGAMTRLPQVLRNVAVDRAAPAADALAAVAPAIAAVEAELGATGRVVVRPSGTEPLVRVMVEAPTEEQAGRAADRLTSALREAAGTGRPASA